MKRLMKKSFFCLALLAGSVFSVFADEAVPVRMKIVGINKEVEPGSFLRIGLKFEMDEGWHIYSDKDEIGMPPKVSWELPEGWEAGPLSFPPDKPFEAFGMTSRGYDGTVYIGVLVTVPSNFEPGGQATLRAKVDLLACKDTCMPVSLQSELSFPHTPAPEDIQAFERSQTQMLVPQTAQTDLMRLLLFAFLGGLILNVMPCVFPVIGLKVMSFVEHAGHYGKYAGRHGLVFTLGVLLSLWALTALIMLFREAGVQLGWGFQLQSGEFTYAMAVVFFVFALNMFGVFEIGTRLTGVGGELMSKTGYLGTLFTGILAVVVATPCSAPYFAPAIGTALTLPVPEALLLFTGVGLGLSLPYLVLSMFPGLIQRLPQPGPWMETAKHIFGFLFMLTVAYLVWVLDGNIKDSDNEMLLVLVSLVGVAAAAWVYGRWSAISRATRVRHAGKIAAAALLALSLWLGFSQMNRTQLWVWEPYSAERVEQLREEGRVVWVDFTARWCLTCQSNKMTLFSSKELGELLKEKNVALVKADWTDHDPAITQALAKLGRASIPLDLLYFPGEDEPMELPTILTPEDVIRPLRNFDTAPAP